MHSKINSFILTSNPSKLNFINSTKKIFINDILKINDCNRYDIITQSLILLIEKENLNETYNWFSFDIFKKYVKLTINKNYKVENIDNYIKLIEYDLDMNIPLNSRKNIKNKINIDNYNLKEITKITDISIINLGSICYINSLIQILFHIKEFRETIIQCEVNDEDNNALNEIIIFFDGLKNTKIKYFDPISFMKNFDNRTINVKEQKDVHEFLLVLLDKLEEKLKNTDNENLIKYFFQYKKQEILYFKYNCEHKK